MKIVLTYTLSIALLFSASTVLSQDRAANTSLILAINKIRDEVCGDRIFVQGSALYEKWANIGILSEVQFFFLSNSCQELAYPDFDARQIQRAMRSCLGESVIRLSDQEAKDLRRNRLLLLLTSEEVLKARYPFATSPKCPFFREFPEYGLQPGMRIAEYNPGTGLSCLLMATGWPGLQVYAIEPDPAFRSPILSYIKSTDQVSEGSNITMVQSRKKSIKLEGEALDLLLMRYDFAALEHKDDILQSIHQSLKPTGRLVIVERDTDDKTLKKRGLTRVGLIPKPSIEYWLERNGFKLKREKNTGEDWVLVFEKA